VLNLYDPEGRLFYHEVLPWSCASLTVDARDPEAEVLLLGCDGRLVGNGPFAALHRRALALVEHAQGPGSVSLLPELRALAWALLGSGDPATALLHAQRAVEIGIASLPPDHPDRAANLNTLGFVELELGEVDAALADLGAALELLRDRDSRNPRLLSDLHFNLGAAWRRRGELGPVARVLLEQGRHAEAEAMVKRALDNDRAAFSPAHPEVARDLQLYGEILRAAGREEDALALEGQADVILTGPPASGAS
jgi:tetratricopeptide (TPR) repeat protein